MPSKNPPVLGDRYEFVRRLARGGMASVFLARDLQLNRPIALKMLHPQFAADESFAERFRREARAAASLSHHNIAAIYDWGRQGDNYFIAMEYVEGQSLFQLLSARGRMSVDSALGVAIGTASALAFAHREGIIHRDIKPGNVLVSSQGRIKVADFGIATVVGGEGGRRLTQAGMVLGTAAYFSPEQARGEAVDARSDLYSLGVVLYETLAGRPPFEGDSPASLAYQHAQSRPVPLRELGIEIPPELDSVIQKLLAKKPDDRYARAEDLLDRLRRIRERVKSAATPPKSALGGGRQEASSRTHSPSGRLSRRSTPEAPAGGGTARAKARPGGPPGRSSDSRSGVSTSSRRATRGRKRVRTEALRAAKQPPGYSQKQRDSSKRKSSNTAYMKRERQRRSGMFYMGFAALLITLAVLITVLINVLGNDETPNSPASNLVTVPSVFELPEDEAVRMLENAGFSVRREFQENTNVAKGLVSVQNPTGGIRAERGSTVTLTISEGAGTVLLPDLVGNTASSVRSRLDALGLMSEVSERASEQPRGEVLEQNPEAGSRVEFGSTIYLDISAGPAPVLIPDLNNLDQSAAQYVLSSAGFIVEFQKESSSNVAEGLVTRSVPNEGTPYRPGERILVYLSSGPQATQMPNLLLLDSAAATARLEALGISSYTIVDTPVTDINQGGKVVRQIPQPNTELADESQIILYIGLLESTQAPEGGVQPQDGGAVFQTPTSEPAN